jgi:hypothetical protein
MYTRIVTHNDLDGLFSAAICAAVHGIERIDFTGPNHVSRNGISVTKEDVVCDLPYPGECGLWFDHHGGNLEELKRLGKDTSSLPGAFALEKSCARVIYNYYQEEYEFPGFFEASVREVDKIDSFDFSSVEEWRAETPARIINDSLKCRFRDMHEEEEYLRTLVPRLAEKSMEEISRDADVQGFYREYLKDEERMLDIIRKNTFFHAQDSAHEFAIIDITGFAKKTMVVRNLAQIIFPEIKGVFLLQCLYDRGVKTNNFSISGSLTIRNNGRPKDIGEIMRRLNIGDGHGGAGSGHVDCQTKAEMEKKKEELLDKVYRLWSEQD